MADYQFTGNGGVIRKADGMSIPPDQGNSYWIEYEAWAADGGVADPYTGPPGLPSVEDMLKQR
jgi:hypothetical protein